MKYKLIENEPFEISGYVNGSPITINALTDFANVIEATSTLPAVAARGTICKLTVPSTVNENLTEEAVSGDDLCFLSDGETWQQITPSITTEDPDGTVEETADLPIGESDGVKSTIYCEVRTAAGINDDEGNVLIVKGADEFLTNAYVPILLRNSNKRNGRGWHHFKSNNLFEGGNSDFCTIEDIIVINGSGQNGTYPLTAKGVKLDDDFNILSHMPAAHDNFVSHGKRKIKLVRTDSNDNTIHVNFKAKWGLAFIKATDFPANSNIRLDVAKLVTTIAPFYVYYRWQSGDNDSWTLYTVLTT